MRATIYRPDGTRIEIDGTPDEVRTVIVADSARPVRWPQLWEPIVPQPYTQPWYVPTWSVDSGPTTGVTMTGGES